MNKKLFVILLTVIFSLNATFAQAKKTAMASKPSVTKTSQNNQLAGLLPNSDAVLNVQMSRLMKEAMPQILATKPQQLQQLNAKIDELKTTIGIDLREFDQLAVGIGYKVLTPTDVDFEPVILARGKFNSGAYLGLAKLAAKGKYREEKIGARTVYVFSATEVIAQNKPKTTDNLINKMFDKVLDSFKKEVAVTGFDDNTLAMGSLSRVREALENQTKVKSNILELASKNPTAILSFGANMPPGAARVLPLENDELGNNIDSIKQMSGGLDVTDGKATLAITAKTAKPDEAQSLHETLSGLQMVGKSLLSGTKKADQQLYSRLIDNATIVRKASEVSLNLTVPKTDMDMLMSILLK